MVGTRSKREHLELDQSGRRERSPHDDGPSTVQKTARSSQEDFDNTGDRPTPVELVAASLVDATAAGPGSTAIPITIPPPAVEVTRPSGEVEIDPTTRSAPNQASLLATRVMPVVSAPPEAVRSDPPAPPSVDPAASDGRAPTPNPAVLKTRLARKITTLADEVNECFADFRIGAGEWRVELTAPEGMSTGGGKHALQRLRLQPTRPNHPMIVVGIVDPIEKTAELRDFGHMELLHRLRFDRSPDIVAAEWDKVLENCEVVLKLANIRATRAPAPPDLVAQQEARDLAARSTKTARRGPLLLLAVVAFVLLAAALVALRVALLSS